MLCFSVKNGFVFAKEILHFRAGTKHLAHLSKHSNLKRKYLISLKIWVVLLEKWFRIYRPSLAFLSIWSTFSQLENSILACETLWNKFIGNSDMKKIFSETFNVCLAFLQKRFCVGRFLIRHFWTLCQYSIM